MNSDNHQDLRNRLLLTLYALPGGAVSKGLIQFSGKGRETVMAVLRELLSQGAVSYDAETDSWEKAGPALREQRLFEGGKSADQKGQADQQIEGLTSLREGNWLEGGEIFLRLLREFLKKGHSAGALLCLDLLVCSLEHAGASELSKSEDARFVAAYKEMLGACLFMGKRQEAVLALLDTARQASAARSDARSLLLLNLYQGMVRQFSPGHNAEFPFSLMGNAVRGIKDFEDPELYESISPMLGVYYQIEGDFHEASRFLKNWAPDHCSRKFDYFIEMGTRYRASGLMLTGHYGQAAGMLEGALREARLLHLPLAVKWRQAHVARFLMWVGRQERALELLDPVLCGVDPVAETKLWVFCIRLLAFYFFHKGNIARAHHVLYSAMQGLEERKEQRPFYGFPWLLELLWAFERQGLPPIPGHDFEKELGLALRSPNKLFRGTALRVQAARREASGERAASVIDSLRESLFYMESVKDPVGMARTRLALARNLRATGETAEAASLQRQACEVLVFFGQHDCLPGGTACVKKSLSFVPDGRACLESLRRQLDKYLPLGDNACFAQELLSMACLELDLERAALFEEDGDSLACVGACNIFQAELESRLFAARKAWLCTRIGSFESALVKDREYTGLCLPINSGEKRYLLFIESDYFPLHITGQAPEVFNGLASLLGKKLQVLDSVRREVDAALQREESRVKETKERLGSFGNMFVTPSMRDSMHEFDQAARTDASILIMGETGVGKEGLARRAHEQSGRTGAFVPVHPGSMPENLFESEFFGHERGAFTGALQKKRGLFELADKGTFFIDEVGDMPMPIQIKLLRVLQEKRFLRIGGVNEISSDFRLVAATNRDLEKMVSEGTFRRDLYYRISVIPFRIPPLRQRPDDVLYLAQRFIEYFGRRYGKPGARLSGRQQQQLLAYDWPGNIRELRSVLERAVILSTDGRLQLHLTGNGEGAAKGENVAARESQRVPRLWKGLPTMEEMERQYIAHVLRQKKGKVNGDDGALAVLGMKRSTLYLKIKKFKLDAVSQLYGDEEGMG